VQNRRRLSSSGMPARGAACAVALLHVIAPDMIWPARVPFESYLTLHQPSPVRDHDAVSCQALAHASATPPMDYPSKVHVGPGGLRVA